MAMGDEWSTGDYARDTAAQHYEWERRASWEAGSTVLPPSSQDGQRRGHRDHHREDPWAQGEDPWTTGRKDRERHRQDYHKGDEDEWREWRAQGLPHGDPEADGRDRRSGWHDPPQERGGHQQSGSFGRGRGKWEPKAEDLWYAKLEEEGSHNWNGKSKEFFVDHAYYKSGQSGPGMRASERLQVPSFNAEDSEDLGGSARSYLRQIEAWKRMTMLPPNKQALVLYQNLSGKAWIAAEELSLARLGEDTGVGYLVSWVTARFLDLEITRIGRALSDFFRKLRRRPNQTVREYNSEYDRLYGRLREVGCCLPEECAAWVYIDRLQLDEPQELNLLASVGNRYDLLRLQQAAVLHDRGHRKPWENSNPKGRRTNYANMTNDLAGIDEDVLDEPDEEDGIPEEVAQAWVTFRSAKDKYKSQQRARGYQGEGDRPRDPEHDNTLKQMKMKSFCSGCGRRGHWHKDAECPNNQGGNGKNHANPDSSDKGRIGKDTRDVAMTTVLPASTQWLQTYADAIAEHGDRSGYPTPLTERPDTHPAAVNRNYKGRPTSSSTASWEAVSTTPQKSGKGNQKTVTPKRNKPEDEPLEHKTMESEVDPAVLEEIQILQTRLALLKDKEGKCCAEIFQQEVIADADFEDAYNKVKEVYVNKHYEHNEPDPGEGQNDTGKPHEDPNKARTAYHDSDFTYATCLEILESAMATDSTDEGHV
ncbi:unnamed protein product [Symbiodinium necroappetens]|uniref:CCHC-type domain-containing protein n=1 Tax=Symbiodinium necroappetens TaxID=1628268 RepID=A0A812PQH1_9DINO|nr:unnamed protein product [Symbiodinium necroappetens]